MGKQAFFTVGSTKFDDLVRQMDTDDVAEALTKRGFSKLVMQVCRALLLRRVRQTTE